MTERDARSRRPSRGFTLVELLAVVAIIGILAAIAIVSYRRYQLAAQAGEATAIIQSIRGSEEGYKAETLQYLGCGNDLSKTFPMVTPDDKKWGWGGDANSLGSCWKQLHVTTDGPVRFGYAVVAGIGGTPNPTGIKAKSPPTFSATTGPWFVVQALGDRDKDGEYAVFLSSSFSGSVYSENDTE